MDHFFRPGDKVRIIDASGCQYAPYTTGTVQTAGNAGNQIWVAGDGYDFHQVFMHEDLYMIEAAKARPVPLSPLAKKVRTHLRVHGRITAMDAMRAMGLSSGSLTRRLTELRRDGEAIVHSTKEDPITHRKYGVWELSRNQRKAA